MTHEPSGATPLDPDETQGLIPTHMTSLDELNEWEQANIIEAEQGLLGRRVPQEYVLSSTFVRELHARMFAESWKWAGQFRTSDKNIGIRGTGSRSPCMCCARMCSIGWTTTCTVLMRQRPGFTTN